MTDQETQQELKIRGYRGKLNSVYENDEDGNTYFDVTPGFLKKLFGGKRISVTAETTPPEV